MELNSDGEGIIVELHKWDTKTTKFDISEYKEAFISPTKQILLLLNHHSQARLLPLNFNQINNNNIITTHGTSVDCSGEHVPSSSECGKADPTADFCPPIKSSISDNNPFIWDVNSLAWGISGDSYDRHEETSFREFLFVCGSQGVTVHAFCRPKSFSETNNQIETGEIGEGRWREWGPSTSSNGEDNESEKSAGPKRWVRTYFTNAKVTEHDGIVWTGYPEKSSYPSSAKVVSFTIFDGNSPVLDFLPLTSVLNKNEGSVDANNTLQNSNSSSYRCSKVFSSLSHHLIGLVLILTSDNEENSQILILVAKILSCGIQWIFSVKLDESVKEGIPVNWSDFGISDNFLICLSKGGKIVFYDITTGEYVATVDIGQMCGLHHQLIPKEQEKLFKEGDLAATSSTLNNQHGVNGRTCYAGDNFNRRSFKRLFISSHTSVFAVIDECGVIYRIQDIHIGLGLVTGWEIGGVDIGHQRSLSHYPDYCRESSSNSRSISSINSVNTCKFPRIQNIYIEKKNMHCDSYNSGFATASKLASDTCFNDDKSLRLARKVFLPTEKSSEDDVICFSSLGVTRLIKEKANGGSQILYTSLYVDSAGDFDRNDHIHDWEFFVEKSIGCCFEGCLYLVRESGISVVLPSLSVSPNTLSVEVIEYPKSVISVTSEHQIGDLFQAKDFKKPWPPWKVEILDRALLYEGLEEVDRLCSENGWDLKIPRIRCLQLALYYLHFDEVEKSLERLVDVHLAEEGVLRLVFAAVFLISHKHSSDNEVSATSRLLALATRFATKMIWIYGMVHHKEDMVGDSPPPSILQLRDEHKPRLTEMSRYLEIIRKLQCRLSAKYKRPGHVRAEDAGVLSSVAFNNQHDNFEKPVIPSGEFNANPGNALALVPMDSATGLPVTLSDGNPSKKKSLRLENPREMINRWELENLDLKTIVKDALNSGRLPLAVLQLHLHGNRDLATDKEPHDTFNDVRDAGRAIAYDLFSAGEVGLAVATLHKLGEDIETSLKQLVFGTVRRSLRVHVSEELEKYEYLNPFEHKALESIKLIERVYPCSSFWNAFCEWQRVCTGVSSCDLEREVSICLSYSHPFKDLIINCGEIDGVVLGPWINVSEDSVFHISDEDDSHSAYWAGAAIWSDAWDQRTIDRVLLEQSQLADVDISWESQLEYHICHNNWTEVSTLINSIPSYSLSNGMLHISLDGLHSGTEYSGETPDYRNYINSVEEIDSVFMDIPHVQILKFSASGMCSMWLKSSVEQQLSSKFIFLKEFWEGTAEIVPLLARAGFISGIDVISLKESGLDTSQAFNKLIVNYCVHYNLPNLLDLYLDHHMLGLDKDSVSYLLEAAGDSQWAKWLLLSKVKGLEYDSSFCNARSVASRNIAPVNNLSPVEINDIILTVDDLAEAAGEMTALATLMYAPVPIQDCLTGCTVITHSSSATAQCTLENLRPALLHFPTIWRMLVATCFEQDVSCNMLSSKPKIVTGNSDLSEYLNWHENIFFSSGCDTSLLQMLPSWFSKAARRLIQLYMQGPPGWQSQFPLQGNDIFFNANENSEITALSWEIAIQNHVEQELYASTFEENGLKLEHHLHRGRALAAFDNLLAVRVKKLKSDSSRRGQPGTSHGQANVQTDVQTFLAPITDTEESLISSVIPLAITHFEDSVLVASCAFLLELCGLSASMLRIDIAALRRISSFYKSSNCADHHKQLSATESVLHAVSHDVDITESLSRALADDYLHRDSLGVAKKNIMNSNENFNKQPSRALMHVLQHLEKVSLPMLPDKQTCGMWLSSGNGDGAELRSQQKVASQNWNLVTQFCQMHQLPLSTKYLAVLARDNDWVGFLSEAQVGGYPFEIVVQVAAKEFSDPRLRIHVITVLKGIQSKRKGNTSSASGIAEKSGTSFMDEKTSIPIELFEILAECEKQKNPGEALLLKAKNMCWSILAMIASCFPDVSQPSCLTVWLEITAARETSSIKVNDIASQIANNVAAAVEATNSLPLSDREVTFHYNRGNAKRRQLLDPNKGSHVFVLGHAKVISTQKEEDEYKTQVEEKHNVSSNFDEVPVSLAKMVAVLCEQHLFLPLLKAFEIFLPSCSLLPYIRALQAFSQMRLSEASAHLGSFSSRVKEESANIHSNLTTKGNIGMLWISTTAVTAANAMLSTCPSPYEKRCLLQLLSETDFGDGGSSATYYRRLYWKINLAEPCLRVDDGIHLGNESLDDSSLLTALEKNGYWEQARNWSCQLEASGGPWKSATHHVTETQAESMVAEWKEFLWDVPEERVALWGHCQTLFVRYSFPALQAGLFFLKHAEAVEKDLPAKELQELLLLSLQWLSGMITHSTPVYPLHLLREIETRVWLLAVESEAQVNNDGEYSTFGSIKEPGSGKYCSIIDRTDIIITKMDNHINKWKLSQGDPTYFNSGVAKTKRRAKGLAPSRRPLIDTMERFVDYDIDNHQPNEKLSIEPSFSRWEERVGPEELERAVLSLLEFGQITAAKELQIKLSPTHIPREFLLVDVALKLAAISTPIKEVHFRMLDDEVRSVIQSHKLLISNHIVDPLQVLESLTTIFVEGSGRQFCKKIIAVVKAANVLGLSFSEAYDKKPIELLQLLSLKAQDSFDEAHLLVQTHSMPAASIAQVLAESFLKGLLAAHRGGYMDSQTEEGPAPLLWRFVDFLKWADLCPSESEVGHALMRLVITGQEIPHACEVELLILSHHFYRSSACLDGVDVLVALAATRVEAYVSEGAFSCLARLVTGVGNFHSLNFILSILIENGQLDLLLQKFSAAADADTGTVEAVRGFRIAVLTTLKQFNPNDLDSFATVYNHFDMKHETASLLESRAEQSSKQWFLHYDKDQNEDLLDSMCYLIEAAEVYSSIDAGNKTHSACSRACLVSLQIRMPDIQWLNLSETNARRVLVEQSRFQEALIVAEAYNLNQASEWALVLWNQMLKPDLIEQFMAEFVSVLPLNPSMLADLARFYRAEVAARGDQSQFSVWLTGGGLPAEWAKYLGRSFRCLLRMSHDLRLRLQLATVATGFGDVINACMKALDKVPEDAGPLVLRRGHGGAYLPLM